MANTFGDLTANLKEQLRNFLFGEEIPQGIEEIKHCANKLWQAHSWAWRILRQSESLEESRRLLYDHLVEQERIMRTKKLHVHPLEWSIIRDACRVLRNIASKRCEAMTDFSGFDCLWHIAHEQWSKLPEKLSAGFFEELHHLFLAAQGKCDIYEDIKPPSYVKLHGREAAEARSDELDTLASYSESYVKSYSNGLSDHVIKRRKKNQRRIMKVFKTTAKQWNDWRWQLKHVIRDAETLSKLIDLTDGEKEAITLAKKHHLPFGITPYYCMLMDKKPDRHNDHAIRAQVIPTIFYVKRMIEHRKVDKHSADFMLEHDTSPIDRVVRRYPRIAIFKPFETCAQICVYCQRNWEIQDVLCPKALASKSSMDKAIGWFEKHPKVREVLITGGDPFIMNDKMIEKLLKRFSKMPHIERIRFGSRTPVVLPSRITKEFVSMLARYHNPPKLDICIVTHFEHVYEVTPETAQAIKLLRKAGLSVYNQMVFTIENSRRFETAATRLALKKIGVDPYYTFIMKGKEENKEMRVPIARALQEQKEENRLMPGTTRSDETVYNVPGLGKNYIRAWQHHDVIMIMPDGSRAIEFHPWEKKISLTDVYVDYDVPIYSYLMELARRGENLKNYESIWYYY